MGEHHVAEIALDGQTSRAGGGRHADGNSSERGGIHSLSGGLKRGGGKWAESAVEGVAAVYVGAR